jgi:DNA-directed RNA polymerase subunit RPC12/RpoP
MLDKKEKQYVSNNAQLMAEWDWEKNNELGFDPENMTCGSGKKVWWKCSKGHEWPARISHRHRGVGCPYCSGRNVIRGQNDLQTVNPTVATEWNFEKNTNLSPRDVLPNSDKKVWWKCQNGHEWQATIGSRNGGRGCPFCSNKITITGQNDLKTINPILAAEWCYDKNNGGILCLVLM